MKKGFLYISNKGEKLIYRTITSFLQENPRFSECKSGIYESISRNKEKYVNFHFTLEKINVVQSRTK
jgi:hypothetical protein